MSLEINLPTAAFQALHRIAARMEAQADVAITQTLYMVWTMYYMSNSRNAAKLVVPNEEAPTPRKQIKTGMRIALPLRPKIDSSDTDLAPLRVKVAPDAHDCIEGLASYLRLTPQDTVWHAILLMDEVVAAMEKLKTEQIWAILPFGFTIKGDLMNPPR